MDRQVLASFSRWKPANGHVHYGSSVILAILFYALDFGAKSPCYLSHASCTWPARTLDCFSPANSPQPLARAEGGLDPLPPMRPF